jgi:hypothetical protein
MDEGAVGPATPPLPHFLAGAGPGPCAPCTTSCDLLVAWLKLSGACTRSTASASCAQPAASRAPR